MQIRGKIFLVAILLILMLMLVPYLPWLKPSTSHQAKIDSSPKDELREEIDSDGDMLVDTDEFYITNTDLNTPDTDKDGLLDGEEYKYWTDKYKNTVDKDIPNWLKEQYPYLSDKERHGQYLSTGDLDNDGTSNILDRDSDSDGLPDGFEVENGLDPADPFSNFTDLPPEMQRYILIGSMEGQELLDFRDVLDMNSDDAGFYGDSDLNDVIFTITPAGHPRYWRSVVYDQYMTGNWYSRNTAAKYTYSGTDLNWEVEHTSSNVSVTYNIRYDGLAIGAMPTALYTTRVYSVFPTSNVFYSTVGTFESSQYIKSFSFNASSYDYDYNKLREANAPKYVSNTYLTSKLPIPTSILQLGTELTTGLGSDFEKASAIAQYIVSNFIYDINSYEYNLNYPINNYKYRYLPSYEKVLVNMLEQTYRGRCIDFATVFVLMCRANDIPAELVTGFAPGEIDRTNPNQRLVKVGHGHAWGEVFLDKFGWIQFEVTPTRAIHGNTTGVSVSGYDENVIAYERSENGTGKPDEFYGGSGGGTTTNDLIDLEELINHPKFDSDGDGVKNDKDDDDDNDGLNDEFELAFGTDPFKKDTDRDGLTDFDEIMVHGTSPKNSDSDSDGLTDSYELEKSDTDPLKYDTDSGGAYDGLEVGKGGNPKDASDDLEYLDADSDGLSDAEELRLGTDPLRWDTDGGGASDKLEYLTGLDPVDDPKDDLKVLDSDHDGLMDSKELEIGSDRYIYDTDSGGIGDGKEFINKKDPLNQSDDFWLMDSDGDGLNNGDEELLGTDYFEPDTDRGGVSDGAEVSYGTDPLNSIDDKLVDSDGDRLSDLMERDMGTDPYKIDTDNDGLPDGWVDLNNNGIKDVGEFEDRSLDGYSNSGQWSSGIGPGETEPTESDSDSDGLSDGLEIKLNSNPLNPDTDGDGLNDWEEMQWLTDILDPDTDNDGLSDGVEVLDYQSNPNILDSDGDGLNDWLEVSLGTNPVSVDSDNDGIMDWNEIDREKLALKYPDLDLSDPDNNPSTTIRPNPPSITPEPGDPGYDPDSHNPDSSNDPGVSGVGPGFSSTSMGGNLANIWPIIIGLILIVVIGLYYINWRGQHLEELAEVAERAEERLSKIEDEREFDNIRLAIFDAYKSMLKVMQHYDFVREPWMTPMEFKNVISSKLPISDTNINALTRLFEEARYSNHDLDSKVKDDAIKYFRQLKFELRGLKRSAKVGEAS